MQDQIALRELVRFNIWNYSESIWVEHCSQFMDFSNSGMFFIIENTSNASVDSVKIFEVVVAIKNDFYLRYMIETDESMITDISKALTHSLLDIMYFVLNFKDEEAFSSKDLEIKFKEPCGAEVDELVYKYKNSKFMNVILEYLRHTNLKTA